MVDQKDIFTGANELFLAGEYFFPQTKYGEALTKLVLPKQPELAEKLVVGAYVRFLELEARREKADRDFLDWAIFVFDWVGTAKESDDRPNREIFSLEETSRFREQSQSLAKTKKDDDWQSALKEMLRGHVWKICRDSPYNYGDDIEKLVGLEKLLKRSITQEES
jgi:hypothetical protein